MEMHHLATRIHGAFRASMHPTSMLMTDRIDALEIRIAHQDATIEDLNAAVTAQWKIIERLERELKLLKESVESGEHAPGAAPPVDKPPHY